MAANNYFGFTHGGTQYATATGYQPPPQAGYAVPPATYTTPRAAATAYDVYSVPNKSAPGGARKPVETRACQRALPQRIPAPARSTLNTECCLLSHQF
ncbi:unnamed protein product [Macrosiphum euphorbiae]|uniref:Uncharacterized protein n=1 Tax=Macrosiphum euphorbiae TaxID=13131 RepID=A0AAV0XCY2_9HEMI|nr:unnamed protein product [Macrosiphum euphorbiae]